MATVMPFESKLLKPARETFRLYVPGTRPVKKKEPFDSVVNLWTVCERSWINWTSAPGTKAPAGSTTTPEIWPVTLWALATGKVASSKEKTAARMRNLFTTNLQNSKYGMIP